MRLLICDDHRLLLDALAKALISHGHTVVATATDPDEAVEAAREHRPDACLLDACFPAGKGIGAIARIHAVSPGTKVVMLSGLTTRDIVADALAEGAEGFVGKDKPISVIIEALELAHNGELAVDALMLQEVLRPHDRRKDPLPMLTSLTGREWDVLRCITDGLSTKEMAQQLGMQPGTARAHVQNVLTKLGVHSRLQAAALMATKAAAEAWPARLR